MFSDDKDISPIRLLKQTNKQAVICPISGASQGSIVSLDTCLKWCKAKARILLTGVAWIITVCLISIVATIWMFMALMSCLTDQNEGDLWGALRDLSQEFVVSAITLINTSIKGHPIMEKQDSTAEASTLIGLNASEVGQASILE